MGKDIIGLILQSLTLIFLGVTIIFELKLKDNDKDIFDIMKDHLNLIGILNEEINKLKKRVEELEKNTKKEKMSKKSIRNVSSK